MNIKRYVIINTDDIERCMVEESLNSDDTIRHSLDGTIALLKFNCIHPNYVGGYKKYTSAEIATEMAKVAWDVDFGG